MKWEMKWEIKPTSFKVLKTLKIFRKGNAPWANKWAEKYVGDTYIFHIPKNSIYNKIDIDILK